MKCPECDQELPDPESGLVAVVPMALTEFCDHGQASNLEHADVARLQQLRDGRTRLSLETKHGKQLSIVLDARAIRTLRRAAGESTVMLSRWRPA